MTNHLGRTAAEPGRLVSGRSHGPPGEGADQEVGTPGNPHAFCTLIRKSKAAPRLLLTYRISTPCRDVGDTKLAPITLNGVLDRMLSRQSFLQPRGASLLLGRDFVPEDFRGSTPVVAILGADVWRSAFAARTDIVGRKGQIEGQDVVVVGVAPDAIAPLAVRKLWLATKS